MNNRIIIKLKSTSGESIAETLVAVLISAFALLMLAAMINTASRLVTRSSETMQDYYSKNNDVAAHDDRSTDDRSTIELSIKVGNEESGVSVTGYINDKLATPVISY